MVNPLPSQPFQVPTDGSWVDLWLGTPRLGRYLTAAGGDRALALALYEWNAQISSALQRDLAHLEVALRNAYDRAATSWGGQGHWLRDGYTQVFAPVYRQRDGHPIDINRQAREQVAQAILAAGGPTAPPRQSDRPAQLRVLALPLHQRA
jgi:hypothetical protein